MTRSELNLRLADLAADVFEQASADFDDALKTRDVALWDSLNHVRLLIAIEEAFGLRFGNEALHDPETWAEFVDVIAAKLNIRS